MWGGARGKSEGEQAPDALCRLQVAAIALRLRALHQLAPQPLRLGRCQPGLRPGATSCRNACASNA